MGLQRVSRGPVASVLRSRRFLVGVAVVVTLGAAVCMVEYNVVEDRNRTVAQETFHRRYNQFLSDFGVLVRTSASTAAITAVAAQQPFRSNADLQRLFDEFPIASDAVRGVRIFRKVANTAPAIDAAHADLKAFTGLNPNVTVAGNDNVTALPFLYMITGFAPAQDHRSLARLFSPDRNSMRDIMEPALAQPGTTAVGQLTQDVNGNRARLIIARAVDAESAVVTSVYFDSIISAALAQDKYAGLVVAKGDVRLEFGLPRSSSTLFSASTVVDLAPGAQLQFEVYVHDDFQDSLASDVWWIVGVTIVVMLLLSVAWYAACYQQLVSHNHQLREAKLQARSTFRAALVQYVCHELRNPLHGLESGFEALSDAAPVQTTETAQASADVKNAIVHMRTTVEDVLDYNLVESGVLTLSHKPCSPESVLATAVAHFGAATATPVKFAHTSLAGSPTTGVLDGKRFRQTLLNVLSTCSKYADMQNPSLCVSAVTMSRQNLAARGMWPARLDAPPQQSPPPSPQMGPTAARAQEDVPSIDTRPPSHAGPGSRQSTAAAPKPTLQPADAVVVVAISCQSEALSTSDPESLFLPFRSEQPHLRRRSARAASSPATLPRAQKWAALHTPPGHMATMHAVWDAARAHLPAASVCAPAAVDAPPEDHPACTGLALCLARAFALAEGGWVGVNTGDAGSSFVQFWVVLPYRLAPLSCVVDVAERPPEFGTPQLMLPLVDVGDTRALPPALPSASSSSTVPLALPSASSSTVPPTVALAPRSPSSGGDSFDAGPSPRAGDTKELTRCDTWSSASGSVPVSPMAVLRKVPAPTRRNPKFKGLTVLVVDDQSSNLRIAQRALRKLGVPEANITCHQGGQESVDYCQRLLQAQTKEAPSAGAGAGAGSGASASSSTSSTASFSLAPADAPPRMPSLMLCDILMPGVGGLELMEAFEDSPLPFPVYAMTGSVGQNEFDLYRASGMAGVLAKPFNATLLAQLLNHAMDRAGSFTVFRRD